MHKNKQVLLAKRPVGEPGDDSFKFQDIDIPELTANQVLIRVCWLSLDPYMRGRMNDVKSYAAPTAIGDIMPGESTGIVIKSTAPNFAVGDRVAAHMGWQTYIVVNADDPRLMKVDLANGTLSAHLGVVGMPGRTAYFGLTEVGKPKPGETLVVAAASGPVGATVGQIARIKGLRAVGIAGGAEKCRYVKEELKFDDCIDYKAPNFAVELAQACPKGIDIYFENVGGDVTRAVAPLLNPGSRAPICGYVSNYNDEDITKAETPFHILGAAKNVPEHRFFVVTEFRDRWVEATRLLGSWVSDGKLKYKECIGEGIESAPELFRGLLKGRNFGKQLVKISDED